MEFIDVALIFWVIVVCCLALIWTFCDEIDDFIVRLASLLKPFNAKAVYKRNVREAKRDCKKNAKRLKVFIRGERNRIKEEINNSIGYCYVDIIFEDNFEWLKKKGFKITEAKDKAEYKISWGDINERTQSSNKGCKSS